MIKYTDEYQTIISLVDVEVPDEHSFTHHQFYVSTWSDMRKIKDIIYPIFEAASEDKKVLVHCELGCSRCTGLIMAYMVHMGMEPEEAYRVLHEKNPRVQRTYVPFLRKINES